MFIISKEILEKGKDGNSCSDVPAHPYALSVFLSTPCPLHYPLLAASQGHFALAGNGPARTKWTRAI